MGVEPILLKGGRQAGNYYLLNTQYKIMVNVIEYVSHASGLHILFYLVGRKLRKPIKFELKLKEISFSNSEYCLGHSFLKKKFAVYLKCRFHGRLVSLFGKYIASSIIIHILQ